MKIGVVGSSGFVGSALCGFISKTDNELLKINRTNFVDFKNINFDILINAATPSKKYWALNNPVDDFNATVDLTANIVYKWKYKKLVQISTISAKYQLSHPYGLNKHLAEQLVLNSSPYNLVFRLGNMFGEGLNKGVIYDVIKGNTLFVSGDSRYSFIDVDTAAEIIYSKLDKQGIHNVSSANAMSLNEIANELNLNIKFGDRYECLYDPENNEGPDVVEVLKFIKRNLNNINT